PTHPPAISRPTDLQEREISAPKSRSPLGWAASIAVMVTGALLWQMILSPPGVSARELIQRARQEEQRPLMQSTTPVVQRTLRSTRTVGGVVQKQSEYHETWHGAPGSQSMAITSSAI